MLETGQYRGDGLFLQVGLNDDVLLSIVLQPRPIRIRDLGFGATRTIARETSSNFGFTFISCFLSISFVSFLFFQC
jgi:hypothetical protein